MKQMGMDKNPMVKQMMGQMQRNTSQPRNVGKPKRINKTIKNNK